MTRQQRRAQKEGVTESIDCGPLPPMPIPAHAAGKMSHSSERVLRAHAQDLADLLDLGTLEFQESRVLVGTKCREEWSDLCSAIRGMAARIAADIAIRQRACRAALRSIPTLRRR